MIAQTFKNMQRHFIVWATFATIIMFAGIQENQNGTAASEWDREPAKGTYTYVLENNTCKDTVEGEYPTGVIVRKIGGGFFFSANPKTVGKALDEEFADKDWHGFQVRNFCK